MKGSAALIERVSAVADSAALGLAMRAWPEAEREAYEQALTATVRAGQARQVLLAAARVSGRLVAAQLGQVLPGKVAVVWPPAFERSGLGDEGALAPLLFARVLASAAVEGAELAQALTSVGDEKIQRQFQAGGFTRMAELLYLCAEVEGGSVQERALPFELAPFELAPFREGDGPRLAALVERTYAGTLDCPGLDGLRRTEDVLAGYRAVGQFRPELWSFVRWQGADVGCLLVNLHPEVRHAEIVYLALVPEVRGRGWGEWLAGQACAAARGAACERVVLAVDAANAPAIGMYQRAGFQEFDRRYVWVARLFGDVRK